MPHSAFVSIPGRHRGDQRIKEYDVLLEGEDVDLRGMCIIGQKGSCSNLRSTSSLWGEACLELYVG
jgi:hypothetical protein